MLAPQQNPVGWFELYVQDVSRAQAFYEGTLQVKLTPLESPGITMLAFPMNFGLPGATGALVHAPGVPSGGSTMVYFSCVDCAEEAARAAERGGKIFKPKFSIGQYGFIALVHDTEGNLIGLHSTQ